MFDENNENNKEEEFQDVEEQWYDEEFNEWQDKMRREKEKDEEGRIWDDRRLSDFDLLKGIMQSEYGNN